jgi:phosphoketolase
MNAVLMNAVLMSEPVRKDSPHKADVQPAPLAPDLIRRMDAYWRAANFLGVGQIYVYDNPLLREPL